MLVSTDFPVPLFHKVYAGNVPDCTIFQTVTEELRVRYRELAHNCEHITLIFDKGNNSEEAFATLDTSDFHFIGSLVPCHHADLLDVPASRYQSLRGERLPEPGTDDRGHPQRQPAARAIAGVDGRVG
jgi:transposase